MTDLLSPADTPTVKIVPIPTRPTPTVRASHRRHGPPRSAPTSARARRGGRRGRWSFVIVLAVGDFVLAMFLLGTVWFPLDPVVPPASGATDEPTVTVPPVTVGASSDAADAGALQRQGGGSGQGGPRVPTRATSTTEAVPPVVREVEPARGQTPTQGPAGGPTTTVAPVPSTVPPTAPETVPVSVPPETTPPVTDPPPPPTVPDTTPPTDTTLLPMETTP